jgi:hypothetical protein
MKTGDNGDIEPRGPAQERNEQLNGELPVLRDAINPSAPPTNELKKPAKPGSGEDNDDNQLIGYLQQRIESELGSILEQALETTVQRLRPEWEAVLRRQIRLVLDERVREWLAEASMNRR